MNASQVLALSVISCGVRSRYQYVLATQVCPIYAAVPPGGILFSHADHERFDLLRHTRSFKWSSETPPNHSLRSDKGSLTFPRNRHLPGKQRKRAELLPSLPAP